MRYIRTKVGIYDMEKSIYRFFDGRHPVPAAHCLDFEKDPSSCKCSDTIEELCDEFVEISPYNSLHLFYSTFNEAKTMNHCGYVFGMNWVFDKNNIPTLKAVAKINVNGELELL